MILPSVTLKLKGQNEHDANIHNQKNLCNAYVLKGMSTGHLSNTVGDTSKKIV